MKPGNFLKIPFHSLRKMSLIRQLNAQLIPLDECLTEEVSKSYANQR